MGTYLIYLKLELKKAIRTLPYFFTGAIVLVFLLGTIAFSASKMMYGEAAVNRIAVGVVVPDDDKLAEKAVQMLASMDSVKSLCDFIYIDEKVGTDQLKSGTIHALMVIPDGFISNIITGINTPATITLADRNEIESMVFKELADAGARILSVGQASIYAADELCMKYHLTSEIKQVENYLNDIHFTYSLPREDYYRDYQVSATKDISVIQYYAISAAALCLLLCGIPLSALCRPERAVLQQKLQMIHIGRAKQMLAKVIAVTMLLCLLSYLAVISLIALKFITFRPVMLFLVLLVNLVIASMVVTIYTIANHPIAGVMCLFWLTIIMLFLSGGLIPAVFLPESMRKLAELIPVTPLIDLLKVFVGIELSWISVIKSILWGAGFYLTAVWGRR